MVGREDQGAKGCGDNNQREGVMFGEESLTDNDEMLLQTNGVSFEIWKIGFVDVRSSFGGPSRVGIRGKSVKEASGVRVGAVGVCPIGGCGDR